MEDSFEQIYNELKSENKNIYSRDTQQRNNSNTINKNIKDENKTVEINNTEIINDTSIDEIEVTKESGGLVKKTENTLEEKDLFEDVLGGYLTL